MVFSLRRGKKLKDKKKFGGKRHRKKRIQLLKKCTQRQTEINNRNDNKSINVDYLHIPWHDLYILLRLSLSPIAF